MKPQFFSFIGHNGAKRYFETHVNGEGYYDPQSGLILGSVYDEHGCRIETTRIFFSTLHPMQYSEIKIVFPEKNF